MFKVGIIGFGYMGHFHYEKVKCFNDVIVTCVYDTSFEKLEEAKGYGLIGYNSLYEFLKEDMDLVVIATPNQWHEKYSVAAMQAGINVLCEKPATMSVAEMKNIIKISQKTGKFFTVHQQRRFDPDYRVVKDIVKNGEIGKITTIESRVLGERGVCFGWRADPESGGGMLYDWGVHLIDQILQLYPQEKVVSIYARLLSVLTPAVDDLIEITMLLSNGVCAKINVGTFALQKLPRWFLFGDRGTLKLEDFSGTVGGITRIKKDIQGFDSVLEQKVLGPSRTMAPLKSEYLESIELPVEKDMNLEYWKNIIEVLKENEDPFVTTNQILRQMKIVEASFISAKKNEVIKVEI